MPPPTPRRSGQHSNGVGARDFARTHANGLTRPPEVESIDLRTHDGWSLRADVHSPSGDAVGVAVLAHALMARRTEFSRPRPRGVAARLVERGWRVVAFDFRGHGDSRPPPLRERISERGHGYDDFVAGDLAAVCAFAREQSSGTVPVVVVGHSLGGHAALAAHATGVAAVDGVAGIASAPPFLRDHEPSRARWLAKRATLA
jgi:predicted alpha/beta hydrolase